MTSIDDDWATNEWPSPHTPAAEPAHDRLSPSQKKAVAEINARNPSALNDDIGF
jgi:hypothetical protein